MSRITLAFACFFKLLFTGKLPASAAERLPEDALPKLPAAPEPEAKKQATKEKQEAEQKAKDAEKQAAARARQEAKAERKNLAAHHEDGALAMLGLLQREGRLVDFLRESLDDYEDADIGAAVRDIHRGCSKVITEHVEMEAVMPGEEDEEVKVPKGFDPGEIKIVGEADGEPPFKGVLRHHGWRVTTLKLPQLSEGVDRHVIAPAEVELS